MPKWLKKLALYLFVFGLSFLVLVRFQGWQYIAALTGSGFAASLPDAASLPKPISCNAGPLQVLSFNVMYGSTNIEAMAKRLRGGKTGAGELPWSERLPEIRERIVSYSPDLLGLQEMETDADVGAIVPLEEYTLVSYHLGSFQYGDSALLFKAARFEQLDSGQVWLGPNPSLPMSLGFRPLAMIRYVNWVLLREKATGFTFIFVNTHFDNSSKNKEPSATLFRDRVASLAQSFPMVVTGDFNTNGYTERYFRFTGAKENPPLLTNVFSFVDKSSINSAIRPGKMIDHIFVGGPCKPMAEQWLVDTRPLKNGQPMSDHYLVFAKLRFSS